MDSLKFTFSEVVALFGVFQCVYVLVYVGFRAGSAKRVLLPFLYFITLGSAFFIELARGYIGEITPYYDVISWAVWALGPPLSALLIIQMSQISQLPSFKNWAILLAVPLAIVLSSIVSVSLYEECSFAVVCDDFLSWLNITGVIAGAASLLLIYAHRNLFSDLLQQKAGKERYWLILALIIVNIAYLGITAFGSSAADTAFDRSLLRMVLGLAFIYLVSTSLFRIYPVALFMPKQGRASDDLSEEEKDVASKIDALLKLDKIYHEPTYSRSDLARELGVPEATVSKVINIHFKKSFPQLLNEYRVEDSKRLLLETDASIKIVSEEVGFNSLPSFNRVFKDLVGQSPSSYRKNMIK
ncbi:MAG: helix-turn-helix domain-containing protein [Alcanivorax sp.]